MVVSFLNPQRRSAAGDSSFVGLSLLYASRLTPKGRGPGFGTVGFRCSAERSRFEGKRAEQCRSGDGQAVERPVTVGLVGTCAVQGAFGDTRPEMDGETVGELLAGHLRDRRQPRCVTDERVRSR